MREISRCFLFASALALISIGGFSVFPSAEAGPIGNQVTVGELGFLQFGAHDLFNVNRGDGSSAAVATDFENGKLDLSTLFIDMTSPGLDPFSDADIALGGEPRNRENILLFSVASAIGQIYLDEISGGATPEQARQTALDAYHAGFNSAYLSAFGEFVPNLSHGCVTMTENLAFRTVHDFLPELIDKDGNLDVPIFSILPPFVVADALTVDELNQLSSELDGVFDEAFTLPLVIVIQPGVTIDIPSLLTADTEFAFQLNTEFPFQTTPDFPFTGIPGFLNELQSGSYASTNAMDQIRNLIAKGYGQGCYVGGQMLPIEASSLILAGAQSTTWLIPVIVSAVGIALVFGTRKSNI